MSRQSAIEIVGGEIIGEKAEMLREHEGLINEVGLQIPPTTVIASETVDIYQASNAPNETTREGLIRASKNFSDTPAVVIRSSAEGDGAGNGVYESRFATNKPELVIEEARLVIGSFSIESAKDFRRQAKLGGSFALMVQPVIGQDLDSTEYWDHFGPYLSGFGYSSSVQHPNGYINVVAGIGGGVDRPGGQIITPEGVKEIAQASIQYDRHIEKNIPLSLFEFLEAAHEAAMKDDSYDFRNDFRTSTSDFVDIFPKQLIQGDFALARYLTREAGDEKYKLHTNGLLSAGIKEFTGRTDDKDRPIFEFVESEFAKTTKQFVPLELLSTINKIEEIAGYPVYVEWALQIKENGLQPVILQIAPAELTSRTKVETEIEGNVITEARNILGNGVKKSSKIVAIASPADIEHLRHFNQNPDSEGYILVFSSGLASTRSPRQLSYADCTKASALVEIKADDQFYAHANGDIVQHLFGASRQTSKFIGEVPSEREIMPLWGRVYEEGSRWKSENPDDLHMSEIGSIQVLEGNFSVYADESTGRLVIAEGVK